MSEAHTHETEPDLSSFQSGSSTEADTIFLVPIAKAGKDGVLKVDIAEITDNDVYKAIILEGLKVYLNARQSKVPGPKAVQENPRLLEDYTNAEGKVILGAHKQALAIAEENLNALKSGKVKAKKSSAKSELPREVQTEAMRIARAMVKDAIRAAKGYPSTYPASEITAMAKVFIQQKPEIVAQARENVAKTKSMEVGSAIDVLSIGKPDPKKLAEREAKAKAAAEAKANKPLSAKQAGKTKSAAGAVPPRKTRGDVPAHHVTH